LSFEKYSKNYLNSLSKTTVILPVWLSIFGTKHLALNKKIFVSNWLFNGAFSIIVSGAVEFNLWFSWNQNQY